MHIFWAAAETTESSSAVDRKDVESLTRKKTQTKGNLKYDNCMQVINDNWASENPLSQGNLVKSAIRWYDEMDFALKHNKKVLPSFQEGDMNTRTKCSISSYVLTALLKGVGKKGEGVMESVYRVVPRQDDTFLDSFLNGKCNIGDRQSANVAVNILFEDKNQANGNKLTHQFVLQKKDSQFFLWQSFIQQYTLTDWMNSQEPFTGPLTRAQMQGFISKLRELVAQKTMKGSKELYNSLFFLQRPLDARHWKALPSWHFRVNCFSYDPNKCSDNW